MIYKLLGYAPDEDPTIPGVLVNCSGVVPSLKGMKGAPSPASTPLTTLGATCQGAAVLVKPDLTSRFFAGTPTKIYEAGTSTWADVSRSAVYSVASNGRWRFAQSNSVSLAVNAANTMQAAVSSGNFSDVAGAPIAAIVETVGNFVFALNLSTAANGWQCAAINSYSNWTIDANVQGVAGTLTSTPGPILAGRRFGTQLVVYKKSSMYLGSYVGTPVIWQFDQIPGTAGALSQEVVVNIGTSDNPKHIFMGEDNFYVYDGAKPVPIGDNRVNQTVFGALAQSRYYACQALHDKKNFLVYFYYPVADSAFPDHCVVYNYRVNRWGVDDRQIEATVEYVAPSITYDTLGNYYTTYNDFPNLPYDSAFLGSTASFPAIIDMGNAVKTLTGAATTTSFTTGDIGDDVNVVSISRIRPRFLTAPTSATWTHSYRMTSGASLSSDNAVSLMNGTFDNMREARWHRGTMQCVGDWELAALSIEGTGGSLE